MITSLITSIIIIRKMPYTCALPITVVYAERSKHSSVSYIYLSSVPSVICTAYGYVHGPYFHPQLFVKTHLEPPRHQGALHNTAPPAAGPAAAVAAPPNVTPEVPEEQKRRFESFTRQLMNTTPATSTVDARSHQLQHQLQHQQRAPQRGRDLRRRTRSSRGRS